MKTFVAPSKKCLRCGACCQTKGLMNQSSILEKIAYRAVLVCRVGLSGLKNPQCPHLTFTRGNVIERRLAVCSIYENRPAFCKEYYCKKAKKNL